MGPWSKAALAIAGVTQAVFTVRGAVSSSVLLWIWTFAGIICLWEIVFAFPWWPRAEWIRSNYLRLMICAVLAIVAIAVVWHIQRIPEIMIEAHDDFASVATEGHKFVRFEVVNNSPKDAWCRAYLNAMWKNDGPLPLPKDAHFRLRPARGGDIDYPEGYLIPSGGGARLFHIANVLPDSNQLAIDSLEWEQLFKNHLTIDPGKYTLAIEVSGKDCPLTRTNIVVTFKGGYDVSIAKMR